MDKETVMKKCEILENELEEITSNITNTQLANATEEEKLEYLKLISEIKTKIEILKSI